MLSLSLPTYLFKYIMLIVLDEDVSASEPANIATVRSASPWACALPWHHPAGHKVVMTIREGWMPPPPTREKLSLSIPGAEIVNIDGGDDWWCLLSQIFLRFFFSSPMPPTGDQLQEIPEER